VIILGATFLSFTKVGDQTSVSSTGTANLVIIIAFLVLLVVIAIPFIDINTRLGGTATSRADVQKTLNSVLGYTTGLFIVIFIISIFLIRKSKITEQNMTFTMVFASMFISLLTMTLFTIGKIPA
jgi:hypothetical protein